MPRFARKFGCYRIEVHGKKKWTPLRPRRSMYFGSGYPLSKPEAFENAKLDLADAVKQHPTRELRINLLENT